MRRITSVVSSAHDILLCATYEELLEKLRSSIQGEGLEGVAESLGYRSKASLSMFLSGRRIFTRRSIAAMGDYLSWSALQRRHAEDLILRKISGELRSPLGPEAFSKRKIDRQLKLDPTQFALLSQWYHLPLFLILSANERFPGFEYLIRKLRKKVSMNQLMSASYALERLGFIKRLGSRVKTNIDPYVQFSSTVPNEHIRNFHHEMISRAQEALQEQPASERDFRALVLSLSPERLPEARQVIDEFIRNFEIHFTEHNTKEICQLNFQLFWHTDSKI